MVKLIKIKKKIKSLSQQLNNLRKTKKNYPNLKSIEVNGNIDNNNKNNKFLIFLTNFFDQLEEQWEEFFDIRPVRLHNYDEVEIIFTSHFFLLHIFFIEYLKYPEKM